MEKLSYNEFPAPADLASDLICIWTLSGDAVSAAEEADPIIPDGCAELIINLAEPFEQLESERWVQQPRVFLHGQLTRIIRLRSTGLKEIIGVRFKPHGCAAFFGAGIDRYTDRKVLLNDLVPGVKEETLLRTLSDGKAMDGLIELLRSWKINGRPADQQVIDLVDTIQQQHGNERMKPLKEIGDRSARTLERNFLTAVGLRPKAFARIVRLRRIIQLMQEEQGSSLAGLAFDAGYYDQAHFNKEFKAFTGKSPKEYFGQEHVLPEYFTGVAGSSLFSKNQP